MKSQFYIHVNKTFEPNIFLLQFIRMKIYTPPTPNIIFLSRVPYVPFSYNPRMMVIIPYN